MPGAVPFWPWFDDVAGKLAHREDSFRQMFRYLDSLGRPVFILETGCLRMVDNWAGDGQSTRLFDRYAADHEGSLVCSVDIDPTATDVCRAVTEHTQVHTGDSVQFLRSMSRNPPPPFQAVDLLYLDSFDLDKRNVHPSAFHHMKELLAASPLVGPHTLVVVDDAPCEAMFVLRENAVTFMEEPTISGKGKYVAEYARHVGARLLFSGYQAGWVGF